MDFSLSCNWDLSNLMRGFLKVDTWIFRIDTWISLCCYMDLLKLLCGFVARMWQNCNMYFSPLAKQNWADVWPGFQRLLKLLLWNKGVDWVKTRNALGPYFAFGNVFRLDTNGNICLYVYESHLAKWQDINILIWKSISYPYFAGHITALLSIGQTLESLLLKH